MFIFRKKRKPIIATTQPIMDTPYCKITVYNKAIKGRIAEYSIAKSERMLVGAIKSSYPVTDYRIEVVYY